MGEAETANEQKDFFISSTSVDKKWAEWIAWQLEEAGYTTVLQAWDFRPGSNFILEMDKAASIARCTLVVLSPDYLSARYTPSEWATAFSSDPKSEQGTVLPVRVQKCQVKGLLGPIVYIDLVDLEETTAHEALLAGVRCGRGKPETSPEFPGRAQHTIPEPQRFPRALPPIWNVPYPRNPYFTGRENTLKRLNDALTSNQTAHLTQPQAISGLGGIGKTQTALEYAYRYQSYYKAVFWVKADTRETLLSDFVTLARLLNLPEKDAQDQSLIVAAVKGWLQNNIDWLLILDNADDLAMAVEFIPTVETGHILLTTHAEAMGRLAQRIQIEKMELEEGALFLLRRAGLIAQDDPIEKASAPARTKAKEISQIMDGLPLALDQAGAYIEETACGLVGYLNLYSTRSGQLLKLRGGLVADHPEPVATSWSLCFEKVEQANPAAADLLRLCAFLHPDAIPEEIVTEGALHLGPTLRSVAADPFELNAAIGELRKYSLLRRDPIAKTLTVHRLVQTVLRESLSKKVGQQWKQRAVLAVNTACPNVEDVKQWEACDRWLPHAQVCATWIEQEQIISREAAALLEQAGFYLDAHARYDEAELLLKQALIIYEQWLGSDQPDTAQRLNNLAMLYVNQGLYAKAEPLLRRALNICEQRLGTDHFTTALRRNNLAELYRVQGKFPEAEHLLMHVRKIYDQKLGENYPDIVRGLNVLALLNWDRFKYEGAEPLLRRALAIAERQLGVDHLDTATVLNNLAMLYLNQGMFPEAEELFQRALTIVKQQAEADHLYTAMNLNNLAELYQAQERYTEAEDLSQRAFAIIEQRQSGVNHPYTALCLNNLAGIYASKREYAEAERLYRLALSIREQRLGANHPDTAQSLNNLAMCHLSQGMYEEAKQLLGSMLTIFEEQFGLDHIYTALCFNNLAGLYESQGEYTEAESLYQRTLVICERELGADHPFTILCYNHLAMLDQNHRGSDNVEQSCRHKSIIREQQWGPITESRIRALTTWLYFT